MFRELNIDQSYWDKNKRNVNHGWGDLYLTPYDFAKLGVLLLQEGRWNGKQVVSVEWLQKIQPLHPFKGTESYGFGWWLDSENPDEIQAMGRGGQRLFVLRERNTVIVTTGGGFDAGDMDDLAMKAIAEYRQGTDHSGELLQRVAQLQLPETSNRTNRQNNFAREMLNKTFLLENNGLEITGFRFEKGRKDYFLILYLEDGGNQKLAMGMDNRYVISREHRFGLPIAVRSFWDRDQLHVEYNSLSNINLYHFTFTFGVDEVSFKAVDYTNNRKFSLSGTRR